MKAENLSRADVAKLIEKQAMEIVRWRDIAIQLRIGGGFDGASKQTVVAIRAVEEFLESDTHIKDASK